MIYIYLGGESNFIPDKQKILKTINKAAGSRGMEIKDMTLEISAMRGFDKIVDFIQQNPGFWVVNDTFLLHIFPDGFPWPHIQISRDVEWASATPQKRCCGIFTITMLESPQGTLDLAHSLTETGICPILNPKTYHLVNNYSPKDVDTVGRFGLAAASWSRISVADINYSFSFFEQEDLPYVWDILQACDDNAPDGSLCIFTNRDICLVPESTAIIRAWLANRKIFTGFNSRVDMKTFSLPTHKDLYNAKQYAGIDTFFWVQGHLPKPQIPHRQFLLGRETWDVAFKLLFKHKLPYNISFHLAHDSDWQHSDSAQSGNKHNQHLASLLDMPKISLHLEKYPFYAPL
jgi:hypothetical protein